MQKRTKTAATTALDAYLGKIPETQKEALAKLRRDIRAAAPDAEEVLSYGLFAFRRHGLLVGFGPAKNHCGFYMMNGSFIAAHPDLMAGYDTTKSAIRFPPGKPLPTAFVKKLVRLRLAENEAKSAHAGRKTAGKADKPAGQRPHKAP